MSFWGESFSFNGRSCEEFGLMLYDFNNVSQGDGKFAEQSLQEDRIPGSYRTLFYDTKYDKPLEFKLVFGAGEYEANEQEPIDRYEMQTIASWLTDQREYGWLSIDQPDMEGIRYRCIITDLETIEFSGNKWAFQCTVHCDSPYGYMLPKKYSFDVDRESYEYNIEEGVTNESSDGVYSSGLTSKEAIRFSSDVLAVKDLSGASLLIGETYYTIGDSDAFYVEDNEHGPVVWEHKTVWSGGYEEDGSPSTKEIDVPVIIVCADIETRSLARGSEGGYSMVRTINVSSPESPGMYVNTYDYPDLTALQSTGDQFSIRSRSSMNKPYFPVLKINLDAGSDFSIVNESDNNRTFTLDNLPSGCGTITVDGERGILSCDSGVNLYNCTNFKWPRLVRGNNKLKLTGHGTVEFTCQYPVNVGG